MFSTSSFFPQRNNPRRYSRQLVTLQVDQRKASAKVDGDDSQNANEKICGCISASGEATKAFKEMMDLSLMNDAVFIMFAISNFLTSIGFNVPYVYTVVSNIHNASKLPVCDLCLVLGSSQVVKY